LHFRLFLHLFSHRLLLLRQLLLDRTTDLELRQGLLVYPVQLPELAVLGHRLVFALFFLELNNALETHQLAFKLLRFERVGLEHLRAPKLQPFLTHLLDLLAALLEVLGFFVPYLEACI